MYQILENRGEFLEGKKWIEIDFEIPLIFLHISIWVRVDQLSARIDLQEDIKIIYFANLKISRKEECVYKQSESFVNYSRYSISKRSNWILT